jgi:hypothetical protein
MDAEGIGTVIDPKVFHSRKKMQIIQRWEYGRISEKQMVDDLVLLGYDREDITDALEEEECP